MAGREGVGRAGEGEGVRAGGARARGQADGGAGGGSGARGGEGQQGCQEHIGPCRCARGVDQGVGVEGVGCDKKEVEVGAIQVKQ